MSDIEKKAMREAELISGYQDVHTEVDSVYRAILKYKKKIKNLLSKNSLLKKKLEVAKGFIRSLKDSWEAEQALSELEKED